MIELQTCDDVCSRVDSLSLEELECKICYCSYNLRGRRPKVLECCHRLCTKCLSKILDLGESPPNYVVCPFCRYTTRLTGEALDGLPEDCNLLAVLTLRSRNQRNRHQEPPAELLLSPRRLSSLMVSPPVTPPTPYSSIRSSPNFVVITIMEPPPASNQQPHASRHRSSSLDSMASVTQRWTVWNCAALLCQTLARALVWMLGLLYFSSLPMGVYLLIMQRTTIGVLLVSLVPASLIIILVYGLCQCICQEFWECVSHR
ncbi:E3 ubiquitin-protein ligase RNF182 [Synchiropus splendidus]|uniref:E3 ubiquitin-protein ligase RNF182 n=1 Tax=Synchiropus splendidus TaxID=270530 RepID=UPI00237D95FA|nr:E3 ubiquitin-protein ligase RNF182 [Synchiropus splendidus]